MLTFAVAGMSGDIDLRHRVFNTITDLAKGSQFRVIILGNFIGRGKHSRYVSNSLFEDLKYRESNRDKLEGMQDLIVLKGMAELRTLSAMRSSGAAKRIATDVWKAAYGEAIARSYAIARNYIDDHLDWFAEMPTYYTDDRFIAVSGFLDQGMMPEHAHARDTVLGQGYFQRAKHVSGKHLIHSNCSTVIPNCLAIEYLVSLAFTT